MKLSLAAVIAFALLVLNAFLGGNRTTSRVALILNLPLLVKPVLPLFGTSL